MKKFEKNGLKSFTDIRRKELVEMGHDIIVLMDGMQTHEQSVYFILDPTEEDLKPFNIHGTTLDPKDRRSDDDLYFEGCPSHFGPKISEPIFMLTYINILTNLNDES